MIPNKSLGQHFLSNSKIIDRVIDLVHGSKAKTVIEIGPGMGAFTEKLAQKYKKVIAIEKDNNLSEYLKNSVKTTKIEIINGDILDFDIPVKTNEPYDVFGSLPYNISRQIIEKFLINQVPKPDNLFFIVQKEVSQKYLCDTPNLNYYSTISQINSIPKKLLDINPGSFNPPPKVKSSLIRFELDKNSSFDNSQKDFIQQLFKHPRRTVSNNLKAYKYFTERGIDRLEQEILKKRPAELTISEIRKILLLYNKTQ